MAEIDTPNSPILYKTAPSEPARNDGVKSPRKTTGEKIYDSLEFLIGTVFIVYFTAFIANIAKHGKSSYAGVPNGLKWLYNKTEELTHPLKKMGNVGRVTASTIISTVVLFHGGNIFAPVMLMFENSRERIATFFNRHLGKPGEVEAGHEHLKDLPKQSWGDVIKGRLGAFAIVASTFWPVDYFAGINKKTGRPWFDHYEDFVGKITAGFTKEGKAISKMQKELQEAAYKNNGSYKFGRILALDLFATGASVVLWSFISRYSAQKRQDAQKSVLSLNNDPGTAAENAALFQDPFPPKIKDMDTEQKQISYTQRLEKPQKDFRTRVTEAKPAEASMVLS